MRQAEVEQDRTLFDVQLQISRRVFLFRAGFRKAVDFDTAALQRGIALNTITAHELPLRGVLGFLVHSKSIRFDDGVLTGIDARVYALAPTGDDFSYRLGGHADLRNGRLAVSALAHDVRDLQASFVITDDAFSTTALHATLGGIPVRGRGAIYDLFGTPSLWLGFTADADLHVMRSLFGFTAKLPMNGAAHFETLLESSITQPLIHTAFSVPQLRYDRFPVDALDGVVDYRDSAVVIDGLQARFGDMNLALGGRVLINDAGDDVQLALGASGAGASLPYTDLLAPDSNVRAVALFTQPPGDAFRVRGTIATVGPTRGAGTFAVTPLGVGAGHSGDVGEIAGDQREAARGQEGDGAGRRRDRHSQDQRPGLDQVLDPAAHGTFLPFRVPNLSRIAPAPGGRAPVRFRARQSIARRRSRA